MKLKLYILLALLSSFIQAQTNVFDQGNALYTNGDYAGAISKYQSVIESGKHSSELYFNMANAHYKLNHIAPSIYYYEKALLLDPNNEAAKVNLSYAKNMTVDAIDTVPEVGVSKFVKDFSNTLSYDNWSKISVIFMVAFVILVLLYYFSLSSGKKRMAFIFSAISLVLMLISLAFAFNKFGIDNNNQPAIVFSQESKVKTEPNNRSEQAFVLHEGTKVQVLDTLNNWKEIKLSDGKTGWISSSDIKLLKQF